MEYKIEETRIRAWYPLLFSSTFNNEYKKIERYFSRLKSVLIPEVHFFLDVST